MNLSFFKHLGLLWGLVYVIFSIGNQNFNLFNWSDKAAASCAFLLAFVAIALGVYYFVTEQFKDDN